MCKLSQLITFPLCNCVEGEIAFFIGIIIQVEKKPVVTFGAYILPFISGEHTAVWTVNAVVVECGHDVLQEGACGSIFQGTLPPENRRIIKPFKIPGQVNSSKTQRRWQNINRIDRMLYTTINIVIE